MAASKQIGIKEVLNFEVFDYVTSTPLFYADYATNTSIESSAERLDLRGGQGNYKLMSFDHSKNMTMKCELPLLDLNLMAHLTGKSMDFAITQVHNKEILTTEEPIASTPVVVLAETPISGSLKVYLLSGDRDNGVEQIHINGIPTPSIPNSYLIIGKIITLNETTAPAGTRIVVNYRYNTPVKARTITMTADDFAPYVSINGYGIVSDLVDGNDYTTVFTVFKAKVKNNWTMTMMGTEATKLNIEFDLYPVTVDSDKIYLKMVELC